MPSDRDENESASGKNDPWAPEETAEAGSTGLQPGGEPAQDPAADGTAYDRAVARSLGDDIGGIRGATDDSYESKLADVERAEAERRKALEIEANFRRKEREKERRAEVLKAELRKKAEARETERLRRLNERLVHQPTRSRTPVETKRTNWHSLADSLKKSMQNLENRVNQIKKERERQRRAYERQQQLEHHRYGRDGWVNSGPWRGRSSGGSSDSRGSIQ